MTTKREPDFSGFATRAGLLCSDGRTILAHAFKGDDGIKVPLLWQHMHHDLDSVLGHAILEDRPLGMYAYGYLNDTAQGQKARTMIQHGDIAEMSIFANNLVHSGDDVVRGSIKEVSIVLAGANPGAKIENVALRHSDGDLRELEDEAVITTGYSLTHSDTVTKTEGEDVSETGTPKTVDEMRDKLKAAVESMTDDQREAVEFMLGSALQHGQDLDEEDDDLDEDDVDDADDTDDTEDDAEDDLEDDEDEDDESDEEDPRTDLKHKENDMTLIHRVFDKQEVSTPGDRKTLSHSQIQEIIKGSTMPGATLKSSFLAHAGTYGIDNIELLFPEAKSLENTPHFLSRRQEWVKTVLDGVKPLPFSRIKTLVADITPDEARAKGYVTGELKKDEVFALLGRSTTPKTIYKKQKLDRDDILDITELDVVAFLKMEMRIMLEEEIARAILIGDGRAFNDPDRIADPAGSTEGAGIRSIANDHEMYAHQVLLPEGISVEDRIDELIRARSFYRGTGNPVMYTTQSFLSDMLLLKDGVKRRVYKNIQELADDLMVAKIVPVEPMEGHQDIVAIYVNLVDYSMGTDKGGQISFFDDFDIDYNQEKYLMETRPSGALNRPKSAVVVRRQVSNLVTPVQPSFDAASNTITVPTVEGVIYTIDDESVTGSVVITESTVIFAGTDAGYSFPSGVTTSWTFDYNEG